MRFLTNAGVSPKTVDFLKQLGHEAVHVRTLALERAVDRVLIDRALADSSVVVTFDLDFGDILALGVLDKPSVIICRLADERADSVNQRLAQVLAERDGSTSPHPKTEESSLSTCAPHSLSSVGPLDRWHGQRTQDAIFRCRDRKSDQL